MADQQPARLQAAPSIVSWNTDDAYEFIVQVLGHKERIPQRYDYTLGTEEMLRRLKARYGTEHGIRCVGLLRWHLGLPEDNEVVDETIWRNWRSYFARHRVGVITKSCVDQADSVRMLSLQDQLPRSRNGFRCGMTAMQIKWAVGRLASSRLHLGLFHARS